MTRHSDSRVCCRGQHTGPHDIDAMMAPYGGAMLLDGHFPSDAFVVHVAVCAPISGFLPGVARECHAFAQAFSHANPEFTHMTGLASRGGLWVCHSLIACAEADP